MVTVADGYGRYGADTVPGRNCDGRADGVESGLCLDGCSEVDGCCSCCMGCASLLILGRTLAVIGDVY